MIVELRAVPDCPNLDTTRRVLRACLTEAGLSGAGTPVTVIERIGEYPSPSVLVDGRDVTGADPTGAAACVLRPPTAEQIRPALRAALTAPDEAGPAAAGSASFAGVCCEPCGSIGAGRPLRAAALPGEVRAVYQGALRHFADTGNPPTAAELEVIAARAGVDAVAGVRRLAEDDLVAVDAAGRLVAAYPFSPTATRHLVRLGGVRVYAMCAIDALGLPAMLGRDATVTSTDPQTGLRVTVTVAGGVAVFDPDSAVVYAATGGDGGTGRSVDTCCSTINFFADTDTASAQAWISLHPGLSATILDQHRALALGRDIFGPLLGDPTPLGERR